VGALGNTSLRAWIVAASLLSICGASAAAGLGKLSVTSALGEPLNAEVELVAEKNEIDSLAARLANRDAFERAGLSYLNLLTDVQVSIEKRASGEPYVRLTSTQPVTEPFVDLLIELTWSAGRIIREFTVLLDPPVAIAGREMQKASEDEARAAPTPPQSEAEPVADLRRDGTGRIVATAPPQSAAKAVAGSIRDGTGRIVATTPPQSAAKPVAGSIRDGTGRSVATTPPQSAAESVADLLRDVTGQIFGTTPPEPEAESVPTPTPTAPVETIGSSEPTLPGEASALPSGAESAPDDDTDTYGPVPSGDTLGKIAAATKPADVSLEQMLVLLLRNNPHAFSGKNINRLKTGKILQLPATEQFADLSEADARKEVKVQARDWRAYKQRLAAAAGRAAPTEEPAQQSVSGTIGAAADDKATSARGQPKEILKLSKNEEAVDAVAGGDAKAAARVRALEEEIVAREKAVKESSDRVTKLEKQIKDLHALLELKSKGMTDLQKPAVTPPAAPGEKAVTPAPGSDSASASAQPIPVPPQPSPVKAARAPTPEPSLIDQVLDRATYLGLIDQVLDQAAYLGAAIGVLIFIGALAARAVKRRRKPKSDAEESDAEESDAEVSVPAKAYEEISQTGAYSADTDTGSSTAVAAETSHEEVDPIAEAEIFLAYGRDAQAEELLTEALRKSPNRHEIPLKLLQIYVDRKDAIAFEKIARDLQQATGGAGAIWDQAVALGYGIDPENSRYAAGQFAADSAPTDAAAAGAAAAEDVDFDIGSEDSSARTADIDVGEGDSQFLDTPIIDPAAMDPAAIDTAAEPAYDSTVSVKQDEMPTLDFELGLPAADANAPEPAAPDAAGAGASGGLDFDIDLSSPAPPAADAAAAPIEPSWGGGLDFDMSGLSPEAPAEPPQTDSSVAALEFDLTGISLDLATDSDIAPTTSASGRDDRWYDVQTKFDLAKAYQEMGDKDGAREILKEVLQEGDAEQQTAAQSVLSSLDS
jgi:pilus assembly protein FimV